MYLVDWALANMMATFLVIVLIVLPIGLSIYAFGGKSKKDEE